MMIRHAERRDLMVLFSQREGHDYDVLLDSCIPLRTTQPTHKHAKKEQNLPGSGTSTLTRTIFQLIADTLR